MRATDRRSWVESSRPVSSAQYEYGDVSEVLIAPRCLSFVAHLDDDLLFMNPDILSGIRANYETRTIYLNTWIPTDLPGYWSRRERGILAAYAYMARVSNKWQTTAISVADHSLDVFTLKGAPHVSVVFLRLPDNANAGSDSVTLRDLYDKDDPSLRISTIDSAGSYSKMELIALLTAIMREFRPTLIRAQNPYAVIDNTYSDGPTSKDPPYPDHPDHIRAAKFVLAASQRYSEAHVLRCYRNYDIQNERVNLKSDESKEKLRIFEIYAQHDDLIGDKCQGIPWCSPLEMFYPWTDRQYLAIAPQMGAIPTGTLRR
jgi:hypothetical protein